MEIERKLFKHIKERHARRDLRTGHCGKQSSMAEVERALYSWIQEGYLVPQIVYWNTAGNAGQPITAKHNNVAMVSGFSPAILKSIFAAEDLTPRAVMMKTLEKYQINTPAGGSNA